MGQLQQVVGAKNKLLVMLDALDVGDKHYARKFQNMQNRLDNLYDRIPDFENEIVDVEEKIKAAYGKQISEKQLYQILQKFDMGDAYLGPVNMIIAVPDMLIGILMILFKTRETKGVDLNCVTGREE